MIEKEQTANEYLKLLEDKPGVAGYVVFNYEGIPMRNTMSDEKAVHYAALISNFLGVTKKMIDNEIMAGQGQSEIEYIRMRTKHQTELIITSYNEFTICCIQDCNPKEKVEAVAGVDGEVKKEEEGGD